MSIKNALDHIPLSSIELFTESCSTPNHKIECATAIILAEQKLSVAQELNSIAPHAIASYFDKIGMQHTVSLDQMEFCLQRRAKMLCAVLMEYQQKGELSKAKLLIDRLLQLILSEYERGFADNDHALMQNTGVVNGQPIHIDVGQFVYHETVKDPSFYDQELFTKTYKFKIWLEEHYPELKSYLDQELEKIIGSNYHTMLPKFRQK